MFIYRSYENPGKISDERLTESSRHFATGILSGLKSGTNAPIYVLMDLDIWRYVTFRNGIPSEHRAHYLFEKEDFAKLKYLPPHWCYFLNEHGEGLAVDFPIKIKPVLSWSAAHYFKKDKKLCKAPRFPQEKLCTTFVKKSCTLESVK